jgi:hypothetical protein
VATFTQLASGNWRVQVRRKTRYVAETFRRRKDGEEWALEMERNIDRNGSSKPRVVRNVRTFGDLIDLHDEDMREVGKPPRRSNGDRRRPEDATCRRAYKGTATTGSFRTVLRLYLCPMSGMTDGSSGIARASTRGVDSSLKPPISR